MERLNFYTVNIKYIRDLAKADDNVLSVSPQAQKETRPFVGVLVVCGDKKYCVPLSSPKPKHEKMKNTDDFSRIIDKRGKIVGVLNFNNMIPVTMDVIEKMDIRPKNSDTPEIAGRKKILNIQLDWCNENKAAIEKKANKLYYFVTEEPEKHRNLTHRCCKFKKLEAVLEKFTSKQSSQSHIIVLENPSEQLNLLKQSGIRHTVMHEKNGGNRIAISVSIKDKEAALKCIQAAQSKKKR